jgi:hypothetical protein
MIKTELWLVAFLELCKCSFPGFESFFSVSVPYFATVRDHLRNPTVSMNDLTLNQFWSRAVERLTLELIDIVQFSSSHIETPRDRSSIIGKGEGGFSDAQRSDWLRGPPILVSSGRQVFFPRRKAVGAPSWPLMSMCFRSPMCLRGFHECNLPLTV